ncbi:MAG TPA: hypothetical protein VIU46_11690 [Gallionellaceae bacterium]
MHKLLASLAMFAITVPAIADDQLSLGTGFDYSIGKYGARQSTSILYIPVTVKYETDSGYLKLTVPYISITGPGGVVRGMGLMRPAKVRTVNVTNSGLGDIIASAGRTVYSGAALSLDLVGNIKFGTADATKDLGTGKNDYSAQIDGFYALDRKSTLFGTAGYKVYGSPAGVTLNNAPYGTLGASSKTSESESIGIMLDVAKRPSATSGDQREVTLFVAQKTAAGNKLQMYILKGFASGSPNIGFGLMLTGHL